MHLEPGEAIVVILLVSGYVRRYKHTFYIHTFGLCIWLGRETFSELRLHLRYLATDYNNNTDNNYIYTI